MAIDTTYAPCMAILDKVLGVGEAVRDKLKETFGEPSLDSDALDDDADASGDSSGEGGAALDPAGAYAALGLAEGATLADVREAYRALARYHHPIAARDGLESEAQRALDRLLEALELLEEHLVPLSPSSSGGAAGSGVTGRASPPPPRRKRATARKR
jgi:hypothetical protein